MGEGKRGIVGGGRGGGGKRMKIWVAQGGRRRGSEGKRQGTGEESGHTKMKGGMWGNREGWG